MIDLLAGSEPLGEVNQSRGPWQTVRVTDLKHYHVGTRLRLLQVSRQAIPTHYSIGDEWEYLGPLYPAEPSKVSVKMKVPHFSLPVGVAADDWLFEVL